MDIDYKDGVKEKHLKLEFIRSFNIKEGTKVLGHYKDGEKVDAEYPGTVTKMHEIGTMNIEYDDKKEEKNVEPKYVREALKQLSVLCAAEYEKLKEEEKKRYQPFEPE